MKKLLIIALWAPPYNNIAARRTEMWVKHLPDCGYEPKVLTRYFDEEQQKAYDFAHETLPPKAMSNAYFEKHGSVYTNYEENRWAKRMMRNKLGQLMHYAYPHQVHASWYRFAKRYIKETDYRPDLIIASVGPFIALKIGRYAARHFQCPWIVDYRDYWIYPYASYYSAKCFLQRRLLRTCSGYVTVTPGIQKDLAEQIRPLTVNSELVLNGIDPVEQNIFDEADRDWVNTFNELKGRYERLILYPGTIYLRQNMGFFLEALERANAGRRRIGLCLCGAIDLKRFTGPPFVHLIGPVSRATSMYLQRKADGLLFPTPRDKSESCFSGKIFEFIASGKPTVVGPTPSWDFEEFLSDVSSVSVVKDDAGVDLFFRELPVSNSASDSATSYPDKILAVHSVQRLAGFLDRVLDRAPSK